MSRQRPLNDVAYSYDDVTYSYDDVTFSYDDAANVYTHTLCSVVATALSHAARYRREQGRRVFVRQMVRQMALSLCPRAGVTNAQGLASRTRTGLDIFVYM